MKANDDESKQQNNTELANRISESSIFSDREIKAIVKDFVTAYLSGQIRLDFPSAEWIHKDSKLRGKPITYDKAADLEVTLKKRISDRIAVAAGTNNATPEQQQKAINLLFSDIIALRNGERIQGIFLDAALEARIRRLEEGIEKVNNLVEEIVEWIFKGVVDK